MRSFSALDLFTLSGKGCDPMNHSKPQEVSELALKLKLRSAGRLIPPGTTLRSGQSFAGRHAPPHRTAFSARFPIGRRFWAASCTPTSIAFSRFQPDWGLSTKCSQVTSGREVIYPCFSFAATRLTYHRQNSISCTPTVHQAGGRFPRFPQGGSRREGRPAPPSVPRRRG